MTLIRWAFGILGVCGCWRPFTWTSPLKKCVYYVYSTIVVSILYSVTFYQVLDLLLNVKNKDEFTESIYLLLESSTASYKMFSLLTNHRNIEDLFKTLEKKPFSPEDIEEIEIRNKFDKLSDSNTFYYTVLTEGTVFFLSFASLMPNVNNRMLPYRAWIPYDYSSNALFGFTYAQLVLAFMFGTLLHVSTDSLICGMLIHTHSQIDILIYRLKAVARGENHVTGSCVDYHNRIYRFAERVNEEFKKVIFVQFSLTFTEVCIDLYLLTKDEIGQVSFEILLHMSCTLTQIFLYCWYGNEIKLKSLEIPYMIFEIDWTPLRNDVQKDLLTIMRCSAEPIEFSSAYVASMNLDSFVQLLKMSYSAYNVLQQGRKQ